MPRHAREPCERPFDLGACGLGGRRKLTGAPHSVPGWHWHFISDAKEFGGHVLAGNLIKGEVAVAEVRAFDVQLPATDDFAKADQAKDCAAELHEVESGKR